MNRYKAPHVSSTIQAISVTTVEFIYKDADSGNKSIAKATLKQ
jgi:hypothetical protein